jgi:hypothetical protein
MVFQWKKISKAKKILITLLFLLLILFGYKKIVNYKRQVYLSKRALIIFVENASILTPEDIQFYENNIEISQKILSLVFQVKKSELENMDILEIIDRYGEPFMANIVLKQAVGYGETIFLTDETAALEDLVESIERLSGKGYVVDLILNVHGGGTSYVFNEGSTTSRQVYSHLTDKDINLGFVYQTACYGSQQLTLWEDLGAEVASGSRGINSFPIFAPAVFIRSWANGHPFEKAVNLGYKMEISVWRIVSKFVSDTGKWITPENISSSKMLFGGNKNLTIYQ